MKFKHLFSFFSLAFGLYTICACSDSSSSNVAGGVTDIGNSIATINISGTVINANGNVAASTRVVAYYDNWEQTSALDSCETTTDIDGNFSIKVDSSLNFVLYAENGEECTLAFANDTNKLVLGHRKSLESSINGKTSGYMRIVGTHETATVYEDGTFTFNHIPPGDISLVYVHDEKPQGHVEFKTTDDRKHIYLPPLEKSIDSGYFYSPEFNNNTFGINFNNNKKYYNTSFPHIYLHMNGYEPVFNSDYSYATDSYFVEGILGTSCILQPGQFIAFDKQIALMNNFTISLWTKWNGTNANEQVLFSEKVNGNSQSLLKWYYDNMENNFVVQGITKKGTETIRFDASKLLKESWTFITLVSNNNAITLYINGESIPIIESNSSILEINNPKTMVTYYIGGTGRDNATWNGFLDEYRIENYAQNDNWIKAVYNNTKLCFDEPATCSL